jgi:RNA polymerase sigma-70 factor (ECF subfamily)
MSAIVDGAGRGGASATEVAGATAEALLLERLRRRDDEAFEQMVRLYGPRLLAVARRLLRNDDDARDALQQAFLSAFKGLPHFNGQSQLATWLHRIIVNVSLMRLRTRSRRPEDSIDDLLPRFLEDGHQAAPAGPWCAPADVLMARAELRAQVRAAVDRLPENYRTVLLLRDIEELDTEDTARLLGTTTTAVKTRLPRARQARATLLDPAFATSRRP